jgi:hypothetical protein
LVVRIVEEGYSVLVDTGLTGPYHYWALARKIPSIRFDLLSVKTPYKPAIPDYLQEHVTIIHAIEIIVETSGEILLSVSVENSHLLTLGEKYFGGSARRSPWDGPVGNYGHC